MTRLILVPIWLYLLDFSKVVYAMNYVYRPFGGTIMRLNSHVKAGVRMNFTIGSQR